MRRKVERIAETIAATCASWSGILAVGLGERFEEDILDPYFVLSFDVFHEGALPDPQRRAEAFPGAGAFESSMVQAKDRFLLEDLPIRIEYKERAGVESLLAFGEAELRLLHDTGTYTLFRLQNARILRDDTGWLAATRARLASPPPRLWSGLREISETRMEHFLSDLGAAARMDDDFFFLEARAGFARSTTSLLFAVNHRFEPSHRSLDAKLRDLARIPDNFFGLWEVFLRPDIEMRREQVFEIAGIIAKSVFALE